MFCGKLLKGLIILEDNKGSGIIPMLVKMFPWGVALNTACFCVTLIWGFDLSTLLGFVIGFLYVCVCYVYLAYSCERAVVSEVKKGKRIMLGCFIARFSVLFALCAFAMLTKHINVVGVLLPQFYPRILFTFMNISRRRERF